MESKKLAILLLFCLALALLLVYRPAPLTVISISKIEILPQGYENPETGEWEGSYWIIAATTDITDEVGAIKFVNGTEGVIADKKLVTKSTITIKIDPHRPYWEIPVTWTPVKIYPKTYQGWANMLVRSLHGRDEDVYVPEKTLTVYTFARGYWEAHTPFTIYVYKNDQLIGSEYIDTVGGTETITIENPKDPKEKIIITNLGKIGAAYQMTVGKLAFIQSTTYAYSEDVIDHLLKYDNSKDSFSAYWFGPKARNGEWSRWEDGSPAGLWIFHTALCYNSVSELVIAPGWEDKSDWTTLRNKPKAATFNDIISYVERYYSRYDIDIWNEGYYLVGGKLRVYMPYGAMSSLITIKISTELADTVVYRPPVANFKIVSVSEIGEVGDRVNFAVKIRQESTVRSTGRIDLKIKPENLPASVTPETISPTLDPGEEATFYFTLINLGTEERLSGTLEITCTELVTGSVTDQRTVSFTLLPRAKEAVILEVYAVDKETGAKVDGIPVTIKWDTQTDLKYTSDGVATWDMKGYTGTVFISSGETPTYKATAASTTLKMGINTVTLYLEKREAPPPPTVPEWATYLAVAVIVAASTMIATYVWRRK